MSLELHTLHDVYIREFYSSLDSARSLTCWLLYSHKEHKQLIDLTFEPLFYNDLESARSSLAATKFLSKATFLETKVDKRKVAIDKFLEAEEICKEANQRIRGSRFKNPRTSDVLLGASFKISNILTGFTADEFVNSSNWGPGSTTLLRKSAATHPEKFSVERRITARAYDFVKPWFHLAYPLWDMMFEIAGDAKIVTVPKNSKTDRVIAIEPGLNLWFQKGIGSMIRSRLLRTGVNLSDQSINQERARVGSKFNQLATIDFSSASDTISYEIVRELLPVNWFSLLDSFRSSTGTVGKEIIHYAKFSSMGNGFTFELESLLFYSLAIASCESLGLSTSGVSVFGDDVILPVEAVDLYRNVCEDIGFTINVEKSYSSTPYRESCGSHFWYGTSIKPIFHKEPFDGQQSVIKSANLLRTFARSYHSDGCDHRFRGCWQFLIEYLGPKCPRIPDGLGDLGIIENFDSTESYRELPKHGYEGFFVRVYAVQSLNLEVFGKGLLLSKLKSMGNSNKTYVNYLTKDLSSGSGGNHIPLPGRVRYVKKRILIQQWDDIGPWV